MLDALFNIGPEATFQLISQGTALWWTWDAMVAAGDVHAGPGRFAGEQPMKPAIEIKPAETRCR